MVVPNSQLNLIGQWVEFHRRLNLESSSYSCTRRNSSSSVRASLVPRPLCGEEVWCTLFAHVPSSLGNLHTTLFTCWKATLQSYTPCETPSGNIAFTEMVYIASFEVIGKLTKHQSRAAEFSWNGQTQWTIPASEELSCSIAPLLLSTQSMVSARHLSYSSLTEVGVMEQILREFQISRNPGGTVTVGTRLFFSSPTHESLGTRLG